MRRQLTYEKDYEALGLKAMADTGDEQCAMQIGAMEIQALQHRLQPAMSRSEEEIAETESRVQALCDQLYNRPNPPSDLRIVAKNAALWVLQGFALATALVSMAGHAVTFQLFGMAVVLSVITGALLSVAVAGAGHLAFSKVFEKNKLISGMMILLPFVMGYWGVYDFSRARGVMSDHQDSQGSPQSFVEGATPAVEPLLPASGHNESEEQEVKSLLRDGVVKIMLAADIVLGIFLSMVIMLRTDEERLAWLVIKKGKDNMAHFGGEQRRLKAQIEIAMRDFTKGVMPGRQKYQRRQHPPYFRAKSVVLLFLLAPLAVHAQSDVKRLEGILLDVSGSVAKKTGTSQLHRELFSGAKNLLQTEPPQSRVWLFLISTESFGSVQALLRGWTPAAPGVFQDTLNRARGQLVAALEAKSTGLSPVAAGTDIIGGLWRVKAAFESTDSKRIVNEVFILSDMMNESQEFPMPALVATGSARMIEYAEQHGLIVPMNGYRIHVYGATTMGMSPQTWNIVKEFWQRYFQKAGAQLVLYSSETVVERK
jgi:hypothetical protein